MADGNDLLITLSSNANRCSKPDDTDELLRPINRFVEEGKPVQDERLNQISELAVQLYGMWWRCPRPVFINLSVDLRINNRLRTKKNAFEYIQATSGQLAIKKMMWKDGVYTKFY